MMQGGFQARAYTEKEEFDTKIYAVMADIKSFIRYQKLNTVHVK